jgi:DNA-binding NtrC family response regulator
MLVTAEYEPKRKGDTMVKHILVVDDDRSIRSSLDYLLRDSGYRVSLAEDGQKALELILNRQKNKEPLDLLVTDNQMPKMSGADLVHELRRRRISLPAVFVSGSLDHELIDKLTIMGCSDFISKPFHFQELLEKVESTLEAKKKTGTPSPLQRVC